MLILTAKFCFVVPVQLKPNSITLAGSKLVRRWSQTDSKLVGDQIRTSFEPASNQVRSS